MLLSISGRGPSGAIRSARQMPPSFVSPTCLCSQADVTVMIRCHCCGGVLGERKPTMIEKPGVVPTVDLGPSRCEATARAQPLRCRLGEDERAERTLESCHEQPPCISILLQNVSKLGRAIVRAA